MDDIADTMVRVLDRMMAIKDDAIAGWLDFDNATPSQLRTIVELTDLSRVLYFALHQNEEFNGC